jgi:hypothetical protein
MSSIRWVHGYDLFVNNDKHFKVFISEDDIGQFHAGCLWYERRGERLLKAPGQQGGFLDFGLETRVDLSEKAALAHLLQWVTEKFGSDYRLAPEE